MVVGNKYVAFLYKLELERYAGSSNNISNPHSKVCIPDIVKNLTVKMFDLMNLENTAKQSEFKKVVNVLVK